MCTHSFIETSYSKVCVLCGIETPVLCLDAFNLYSAPLERSYSRLARFQSKVERLLGVTCPRNADPVWEYLEQRSLSTPSDIRIALRISSLKDKHYDSIRVFCDCFTDFKCAAYDHAQTHSFLLRQFEFLHNAWSASFSDKHFFSYDWLLRHFLEHMKSPLVDYLKPATSKRRAKKYLLKLQSIQCVLDDKMLNHGPLRIHLQSV